MPAQKLMKIFILQVKHTGGCSSGTRRVTQIIKKHRFSHNRRLYFEEQNQFVFFIIPKNNFD